MTIPLKAPFPWFGGKARVAEMVWHRLGDVDNLIEPFFGSGAVLIARPHPPRIETINDLDCYVANFWRATQHAPELVAEHADGPVNEADLHSRHRWLVLSDHAAEFRRRMRSEPWYFDARVAGWWVWGLCCWIGSGWCAVEELRDDGLPREKMPKPITDCGSIHAATDVPKSKVRIAAHNKGSGGEGQYGHGVHAKGNGSAEWEQIPLLGDLPRGVHRGAVELQQKRPRAHRAAGSSNSPCNLPGVLAGDVLTDGNRPQLADAFSRGRGVHGHDEAGTCEQRRVWLLDWFNRLRDRLRTVRVCCGGWLRVCDSPSVTTRLGTTGIFFDPPYGTKAERTSRLYSTDSLTVAEDVRRYCLERGSDHAMRIVLAGYAGEGHEELERHNWEVIAWNSPGGYGNRSEKGKANAKKERLWISPHCVDLGNPLFEGIAV